ncbi:MAG: phage tail protein [Tannerella sp.]|jgi:predicted secreted protein|nr:phage tail protein [Tannerella sp.]
MGQIMKGGDLMLFITVGGTKKSIAFATSHSLSISGDTVETSTKDSSGKWTSKQVNRLSWNVSTDNLYSLDGAGANYSDLFGLMSERSEIDIVFALESGYASKADSVPPAGWTPLTAPQYAGRAVMTSLELNAPNGENATFKASFEGVGALTATPAV